MGLSERKVKRHLVGSAVSSNAAWTANDALPGQRMLASMGWAQGQGLGLSAQGSAAPISVAFKLDNKGLGVQRAEKEARSAGKAGMDWLGGGSDYEALLQRLNAANAPGPAATTRDGDQDDASSSSGDEAQVEASKKDKSKKKEKSRSKDRSEAKEEKKHKKSKSDKKRKAEQASDEDDDRAEAAEAPKEKKRKKSKKDGGKHEPDSLTPPAAVAVVAVAPVVVTPVVVAPHRLAHRAKYLRAKGLLGPEARGSPVSGSRTPLTLTPSSALSPAPSVPASPAPALVEDAELEEAKPSRESKAEKKSKKTQQKAAKVALDSVAAPSEVPPPTQGEAQLQVPASTPVPIMTDPLADPIEPPPSKLSVQAYLANKLIRRKAEIARAKREAENALWGRAAAASSSSLAAK
ncbi:hypothetical protein V8E36_002396 [Tilletia maclaganii]